MPDTPEAALRADPGSLSAVSPVLFWLLCPVTKRDGGPTQEGPGRFSVCV